MKKEGEARLSINSIIRNTMNKGRGDNKSLIKMLT